jgi:5-carboxymethyl-2-hydroxymuconate isomerase
MAQTASLPAARFSYGTYFQETSMPHLFADYSNNLVGLNEQTLLEKLNAVVCVHATVADEADLKSRIAAVQQFRVGTQPAQRGFVHVQLRLLAGRTPEIKKELSDALAAVLRAEVPQPAGVMVQLSVEIVDMDKGSYYKGRL